MPILRINYRSKNLTSSQMGALTASQRFKWKLKSLWSPHELSDNFVMRSCLIVLRFFFIIEALVFWSIIYVQLICHVWTAIQLALTKLRNYSWCLCAFHWLPNNNANPNGSRNWATNWLQAHVLDCCLCLFTRRWLANRDAIILLDNFVTRATTGLKLALARWHLTVDWKLTSLWPVR